MKYGLMVVMVLICMFGWVIADRLPNQTPENQIFTVDTVIDATGTIDSSSDLHWLIASPGAIETGILANHVTEVDEGPNDIDFYNPAGKGIADVVYKDSILTNGGRLSENKNFDFDSKNKALGLYNIESSKVLTYTSMEGAHLVGEEAYTLDVAGEAKNSSDNIRCVFAAANSGYLPPFCNVVTAKSSLININSAQISSKGQIRAVAKTDDIPAELNYQIAVTPDANSGSGFAEGTVKTIYAGSVMEGRDTGMYLTTTGANNLNDETSPGRYKEGDPVPWDVVNSIPGWGYEDDDEVNFKTSAENTWKDTTAVTGGIKNFQKAFAYKSGFMI